MADKTERNSPCHCGSGKKFKNCCRDKGNTRLPSRLGITGIVALLIIGLVIVALALSGGNSSQDCPPGTEWSAAHQHCH